MSTYSHLILKCLTGVVVSSLGLGCALATNPQPGHQAPFTAQVASPIRDWQQEPAIVDLPTHADILAVGDIHGDIERLQALLRTTGVVKLNAGRLDWSAGTSILVCTGDIIDKWNHGLEVIAYLQQLQAQAKAAGGQVIVTMGNHEAEFLADPANSKADAFVGELQAAGIAPADVAAGRHPLGRFLRSLPFAARIGSWFFVHAGNTAGRSFTQLNQALQTGVDAHGYADPVLSDPNSLLEARLSPAPWWEGKGSPEQVLTAYTHALGVEHIVMGHQPGKVIFADGSSREKGILVQKFGRIFLIDTGMSQGVDHSHGVLLKIQTQGPRTDVSALYPDGRIEPVWMGQ